MLPALFYAQSHVPVTAASRTVHPADSRAWEFERLLTQKEDQVGELLQQYGSADAAVRDEMRQRIRQMLFEIFDLHVAKQEAEARSLRETLAELNRQANQPDRAQQIQQLNTYLDEVENRLAYRRENRERIVGQRLDQVLALP
ncbi:MAG: hypothetical protein OHK0039_46900 [Bacteroidia bacterium]